MEKETILTQSESQQARLTSRQSSQNLRKIKEQKISGFINRQKSFLEEKSKNIERLGKEEYDQKYNHKPKIGNNSKKMALNGRKRISRA